MRWIVIALLIGFLAAAQNVQAGEWVVCWTQRIIGVDRGHRYHCRQCYSKYVEGVHGYGSQPNCRTFIFLSDADFWYSQNCDCD